MDIELVATEVVDAAFWVHRRAGPGMLESVYQALLAQELTRRGLRVDRQVQAIVEIEGLRIRNGLRVDLIVEGVIAIEVKAVETLAPVHWRQVLTYLRALDLRVGFLINFGGATLKEGLHRIVNNYEGGFRRRE